MILHPHYARPVLGVVDSIEILIQRINGVVRGTLLLCLVGEAEEFETKILR